MALVLATVLKTSLLLAAGWIASRLLGRASASLRHLVWVAALAAVLLLPLAERVTPRWRVGVPAAGGAERIATPAPVAAPSSPAPRVPSPLPAERRPAWFWLWAAGVVLVAVRWFAGVAGVVRLLRGAAPAAHTLDALDSARRLLALRRRVRVFESPRASVPMTWGVWRPVVLLPAGSAAWPAARLRSVLLHELAHIRRADLLSHWLARLVCVVYWFHPLAWLAARELGRDCERACDDAVLNLGVAAPDYADDLVALARGMRARRAVWAPAMAEASDLEGRVRALLDRRRDRRPVTCAAAAIAVAASVALLLPVAALDARAQTARGALAGVVKDPSGGTVPHCSVTARNLDGRNQEAASTNDAGEFRFGAVPAGRYTLEFRAPGFRMASQEVVVPAGQATRADATLNLGAVSETVVVTGKRPAPPPLPAGRTPQRIRVGGNVQATRLVSMARPAYPERLQQLGVEGTVLLRAVISVEGTLLNLEVANTDVNPDLAQAALEAVRQWRYQPTLLNGQPVEVVTTITVEFRLER